MPDNVAPINIIIKKKINHGGHHGGAWKVAYADFVTAMMALFIVLWLLSSSEKVKKAVGGYFQDPTGYGKLAGSTMAGTGESVTTPLNMEQIKEKLEQALKKAPEFQAFKDHIQITVTGEGLRIELLETKKGMFFTSGSAHLSAFGRELLSQLAKEFSKLPNQILVEGHTDAAQFSSGKIYSNWELSADRANEARRWMQDNTLRADQVTQVRGFADQRLRNTKDPTDPANRRISLIVLYLPLSPADIAAAVAAVEKVEKAGHGEAAPAGEHGKAPATAGHAKSEAAKAEPAKAEPAKAQPGKPDPATQHVEPAKKGH
jgi:chemotaxis protein MotB